MAVLCIMIVNQHRSNNLSKSTGPTVIRFAPRAFMEPSGGAGRVLLLQGPVGPCFKRMQIMLADQGVDAWRVCFNLGDLAFSSRNKRISFLGNRTEWRDWLDGVLSSGRVDTIVLFGSERVVHRTAREIAPKYGVKVIALEEGYIRPGLVTVETSGNNAASPLAGQVAPVDFSASKEIETLEDFKSLKTMSFYGALYYTAMMACRFCQSQDLFHRKMSLLPEAFFWARNLTRRVFDRNRNFSTIQKLLEHFDGRYFVVPLQVAEDGNMKDAALGWNSVRLIAETIRSFSQSAPANTRLVFKIHPMERGHSNHAPLIRSTAAALGVENRVDVIDTGSLGLLARHAAGMITITSTSGLSAIFHGIPLLVIGKTIYANPRLATCARGKPNFNAFWTSRHVASPEVRKSYIAWIREAALEPGDYYATKGIELVCQAVLKKINSDAKPQVLDTSERVTA